MARERQRSRKSRFNINFNSKKFILIIKHITIGFQEILDNSIYMNKHNIKKIISGGQTGVDRAALDVAINLQIRHGGWCPNGRKAEDGIIPHHYHLKEAPHHNQENTIDPNQIYNLRTELNVRSSDGTLILTHDTPAGGTLYTIEMIKKYEKPYLIFYISENNYTDIFNSWINTHNIQILNVAGPRASQATKIYSISYNILQKLFTPLKT